MALDTNLVSYYKLDSNSNDSVGTNNGTDTSVSYVSGKIGNAGSYNGSTSRTSLWNKVLSSWTTATISMWINNSNAAQWQDVTILSNQYDTWNYWICLARTTSGTSNDWNWFFWWGWGSYYWYGANTFSLPTSTWTHIAVTVNWATMKQYINWAEYSSVTYWANINFTSANNMFFWQSSYLYAWRYFNWLIDEVGIWSRALSSTEITELYNAGAWITYPFTAGVLTAFFMFFMQ